MTLEQLAALEQQAAQATTDWPEVKKAFSANATVAYVHGMKYRGPSIDFDAMIDSYPSLIALAREALQRRINWLQKRTCTFRETNYLKETTDATTDSD